MRRPYYNGNYPLTQAFGANKQIYGGSGHRGEDVGLPGNTPILATRDGVVRNMGYQANGFGYHLTISFGVYTIYHGHLARVTKTGSVKKGQQIGLSNNSGWSSGNHCHTEIYKGRTLINPESFFNPPKPGPTLKKITVIVPGGANLRSKPTTKSKVVKRYPYGTQLWASRRVAGESVSGNRNWFRIAGKGYISGTVVH